MSELVWRKSSRSGSNGNCVEVALRTEGVAVRDSKDRAAGHFGVSARQWRFFLARIKHGYYDG